MGTQAATRIIKNNDYVGFHTRYDGFYEENKDDVLNITRDWSLSISEFKSVLEKGDFGTSCLKGWITDLEKCLESYIKEPTIDTASFFLTGRSFTNHLPNPNKDNNGLLEYWNADNPDFIFNLDNEISFKEAAGTEVYESNSIDWDETYKVFRIQSPCGLTYIDLKFKDISIDNLIKEIFLLPLFWRDLYTIYKKIEDKEFDEKNLFMVDRMLPIFKLCHKLKYFYNPIKKYSNNIYAKYATNKVLKESEKIKMIENIKDDLISLIPFDMYVNSLAAHFMIRFPNKVFPLTFNETKLNKEPLFKTDLNDRRLSSYSILRDGLSNSIEEIENEFKKRESKFNEFNNLPEKYNNILIVVENSISINYEESIINVMESQRDIEIKDLNRK